MKIRVNNIIVDLNLAVVTIDTRKIFITCVDTGLIVWDESTITKEELDQISSDEEYLNTILDSESFDKLLHFLNDQCVASFFYSDKPKDEDLINLVDNKDYSKNN
jgi:hypothetical protein